MTLKEAAVLLLLSEGRVCELVRDGEIPGEMRDGRWHVDREAALAWKAARKPRTERMQKTGMRWRHGMILNRRQWRCRHCLQAVHLNNSCPKCGCPRTK